VAESGDDMESRIRGAALYAEREVQQWIARGEAASATSRERMAASIYTAAFSAVRAVLEEVLVPGCHAAQEGQEGGSP
jgi:hypothetical protein